MVLRKVQKKLSGDSFSVADDKGVRLAAAKGETQLGRLTSSAMSSLKPAIQQRVQANITRREPSGAAVLRDVRDGSVDAGLVLKSDVNRRPAQIKIADLPGAIGQDQSWQAAVRRKGMHRDAARALVKSLFDGKAARQLRSLGLPQSPQQPAEGKPIPAG
jgi:ABC-type molybdate transport system substrate-binding protein